MASGGSPGVRDPRSPQTIPPGTGGPRPICCDALGGRRRPPSRSVRMNSGHLCAALTTAIPAIACPRSHHFTGWPDSQCSEPVWA
jgi:hypothetical protein